jgi:hypothetical protein
MKEKRTGQFIGSIFGNILALAIVNTVLIWRQYTHGVILESWVGILWAANLSLIVQIAGSLILAFYRPAALYAFMEMVFAGLGLLSMIVFFIVFPLDFSGVVGPWLNTLLKVVIALGMAGASIGILVWMVRLVSGKEYTAVRAG